MTDMNAPPRFRPPPPSYDEAQNHQNADKPTEPNQPIQPRRENGSAGGMQQICAAPENDPGALAQQDAGRSVHAQVVAPAEGGILSNNNTQEPGDLVSLLGGHAVKSDMAFSVRRAAESAVSPQQHHDWVVRVAKIQLSDKMDQQQRAIIQSRAEELKNVQRTRAKCSSIIQRGNKVKKEMTSSVQSISAIRSLGSGPVQQQQYQQLALVSGATMQSACAPANEQEEINGFLSDLAEGRAAAAAHMDDSADRRAVLAEMTALPSDNNEAEVKFKIYENFASTSLAIRSELFQFVDTNASSLGQKVIGEMKRALQGIDQNENLCVRDSRENVWFVRDMAEQVYKNMDMMSKMLQRFEKKLELLAHSIECPVCLEPFGEGPRKAEVLGCCHSVCSECWSNINLLCVAKDLCPVCRFQDFAVALGESANV